MKPLLFKLRPKIRRLDGILIDCFLTIESMHDAVDVFLRLEEELHHSIASAVGDDNLNVL